MRPVAEEGKVIASAGVSNLAQWIYGLAMEVLHHGDVLERARGGLEQAGGPLSSTPIG